MDVVKYARVSSEEQDTEDKVSIEEQLEDEGCLIERNEWRVLATFIDNKRYVKTKAPHKGKRVNPSGEYDDRPALLEMLALVRTGQVDAIVCWRDDRLVRHPRVAVTLEDALDEGDRNRQGKPGIRIYDATGSQIDRFTLGIKAQVWREENKRRSERYKMGKIGTLKQGFWPGFYNRYGYQADESYQGRGIKIILGSEDEIKTVKDVFNWYDEGAGVVEIRRRLIAEGRNQRGWAENSIGRPHLWNPTIIERILRSEDYIGKATWTFNDGTSYSIKIPAIISKEQWKRVQKRMDKGSQLSKRNTKSVYLLQHLVYCGDCGGKCYVKRAGRYFHKVRKNGERKRSEYKKEQAHRYECTIVSKYREEEHTRPFCWHGRDLDYEVWTYITDKVVEHPDLIIAQVKKRQTELKRQGESVDGDIARLKENLKALEKDKMTFTRQLARGKISESVYDALIKENEETVEELNEELNDLLTLRDDQQKVKTSIDVATQLLNNIRQRLPQINHTPEELKRLTEDQRREILLERQKTIRALCDRILLFADGRVEIEGLIDPSKSASFEIGNILDGLRPAPERSRG